MLLVFVFVLIILIVSVIYSCNVKFNIVINDKGYRIIIYVFIFGHVCVYKTDSNSLIKKSKKKKLMDDRKYIIKIIKRLNLRAEEFNAKILVGTSEVQSTAIIAGILNSIIGILLKSFNVKITKENFIYKVVPIYSNKKALQVKIKCIFSSSLVHIISTMYRYKKDWRCKNYGRESSNRRANGNGNG